MILWKGKGWRQSLGVWKLSWLVRRQIYRKRSGVLVGSKLKRSQQHALEATRVDHTSCNSESKRGRSGEGRAVYPELCTAKQEGMVTNCRETQV